MIDSKATASHLVHPISLRLALSLTLRGMLMGSHACGALTFGENGVRVATSHAQLLSLLALGEALQLKAQRSIFQQCLRPTSPPTIAPREWLQYVGRCALQLHREAQVLAGKNQFTWANLQARRRERLEHVRRYAAVPMLHVVPMPHFAPMPQNSAPLPETALPENGIALCTLHSLH